MSRTVTEWVGKNDDAKIPNSVKDRIVERQGGVCAISGVRFAPGVKPQFDHKTPLWLGGKHVESNLQAITVDEHQKKTKTEATVRAKINSQRRKHTGIVEPKGNIKSAGFVKQERQPKRLKKELPVRKRDVFGRPVNYHQ